MVPLLWMLVATGLTPQQGRRPVLRIISTETLVVEIEVRWNAASIPGTYARYEWEARNRNVLLADDTTASTVDTMAVRRPRETDTLEVRTFVRGIGPDGPGPWGWGSDPLLVPGAPGGRSVTGETGEPPPSPTPTPGGVATRAPAEPPRDSTNRILPLPDRSTVQSGSPVQRRPPPPPERRGTDSVVAPLTARPQPAVPSAPQTLPKRGGSHEPDDYRTIVGRPFDSRAVRDGDRGEGSLPYRHGGSEGFDGIEYRSDRLTIVQAPDAPLSPPNVLDIRYPRGMTGGRAPGTVQTQRTGWTNPEGLYIRYAFRLSRNFAGHPTTTNKIFHYWVDGNRVFDRVVGSGNGRLQYQVAKQGGAPSCQRIKRSPANSRLIPNRGNGSIERGRWYIVELQMVLNTPGGCDGTVRAWLNGRLIIEYTDIGIRRSDEGRLRWQQIQLSPTWGGGGSRVPHDFHLQIDDIYVSGR